MASFIKFILAGLLVPVTLIAFAQQRPYIMVDGLDKTYGGNQADNILDLIQSFSGEYVAVGETKSKSEGGKDILFLRVDQKLKEITKIPLGRSGDERANAVVQTHDGDFVLAGYSMPKTKGSQGGAFLLKVDEAGKTIWNRNFGADKSDYFQDVAQLPDGSLILTGSKNKKFWYLRVDHTGKNILAEKIFFEDQAESAGQGILYTSDKQIVITGYQQTSNNPIRAQAVLLKIDLDGGELFQRDFPLDKTEQTKGARVIELEEGGFAIVGQADSRNYKMDMLLIVTDAYGEPQFKPRPSGGTGDDNGFCLVQEWGGDLIMGGDTKSHTSGARRSQLWIRKTSAANGDPLWKKDNLYLGGQQNDVCNALLINHEGALLAAGYSNRPGKGDDAWILQFDNRPKAPEVRSDLLKIDSLAFYEWDQNAEINPGERAYIGFQITNENRSLFTGLYAEVRQTHGVKGISIVPNLVFPGLRPQSTTFASIPLIGAESLTQGDNIFEIVFRNAAGYEIKRFTIDIKSNKRPKPELHISEARFETAHGGATTRSETIKLTFKLENSGNQTASQVAIRTNISGDASIT